MVWPWLCGIVQEGPLGLVVYVVNGCWGYFTHVISVAVSDPYIHGSWVVVVVGFPEGMNNFY